VSYWTISNYSLRKPFLVAQGYRCGICGKAVMSHLNASYDHVWPMGKGGYDGIGNVVVAHKDCNSLKADDVPTGCQIVFLVALCERMHVPVIMKEALEWQASNSHELLKSYFKFAQQTPARRA
jgi:hypothetical protein